MTTKENVLQRALRRFTSSNAELESEDLQRTVREEGAVPIRTCGSKRQVTSGPQQPVRLPITH